MAQTLMHQAMIEFNNQAVEQIKLGNFYKAFEFLSHGVDMLPQRLEEDDTDDYPELQEYNYSLCDCTHVLKNGIPDKLRGTFKLTHEGCLPYLYTMFMKVYPQINIQEAGLPVYGFGWVMRYNLSILCTVYGSCLGERGQNLLCRAEILMEQVQIRIEEELLAPTKHWTMIQLALLNNQACVSRELGEHNDMVGHLDDIANVMASSQQTIATNECKEFLLCAELLLQSTFYAGAA